jgi:hypothetical protein
MTNSQYRLGITDIQFNFSGSHLFTTTSPRGKNINKTTILLATKAGPLQIEFFVAIGREPVRVVRSGVRGLVAVGGANI